MIGVEQPLHAARIQADGSFYQRRKQFNVSRRIIFKLHFVQHGFDVFSYVVLCNGHLEGQLNDFVEETFSLSRVNVRAVFLPNAQCHDFIIDRQDEDAIFAVNEEFQNLQKFNRFCRFKAIKIVNENDDSFNLGRSIDFGVYCLFKIKLEFRNFLHAAFFGIFAYNVFNFFSAA